MAETLPAQLATSMIEHATVPSAPSVAASMQCFREVFEGKTSPCGQTEVTYYEIVDRRVCKCCGRKREARPIKTVTVTNHDSSKVCIRDLQLMKWQR